MMMRTILIAILVMAAAPASAGGNPRVSLGDARKAALAKVPGAVEHEKLKHKHGFVYSFKIHPRGAGAGALERVEVDGDSGKVLRVKDLAGKGAKDKDGDD